MTLRRCFWLSIAALAVGAAGLAVGLAALLEEYPELYCAEDEVIPVHGCTWGGR